MGKPFIKLVRSLNAYYFFDVNKNQIVRIPESTYCNLDKILSGENIAEDQTIERLKKMGFLSDFHVQKIEHPLTGRLGELLESKMKALVLQITQNCNFRCSYCVYSESDHGMQRSHSGKSMDIEMAKASIDYFAAHAGETQNPMIVFYGGEPLLEFEKMKCLIAYAKNKFAGQHVSFTFTTNGALLTPEIVEYCYENKIRFMLSLDGLERIQNISRRFAADGKGSFQKIKDNITYIQEKYPDYMKKLTINMVIDQQNDYDEIIQIFSDPVFGEVGNFMISDMEDHYSLKKTIYTKEYFQKEEYHKARAISQYLETGEYNGNDQIAKRAVVEMEKTLHEFRPMGRLPEKGSPSGPCVPGQSKLFVNAEGDFFPCERVSELSECMKIGNIRDGIDLEAAKRLLNIGQLTEESCKKCWAFFHCSLCAKYADNYGCLSGELKASYCDGVRSSLEKKIKEYIMVKEYNKEM